MRYTEDIFADFLRLQFLEATKRWRTKKAKGAEEGER
jgi:hypothetical protein